MTKVRRTTTTLATLFLGGAVAAGATGDSLDVSPVFGVALPADYRNWGAVSAAHEAGSLDDIRIILANSLAMKAYRSGERPFPDGAMIVRVAWKLEPSPRNNVIFGQPQSFVAGNPTNVQIEVKDRVKYAATGGWGYGQFENGKANPSEPLMKTCFACHQKLPPSADFIFTPYSL